MRFYSFCELMKLNDRQKMCLSCEGRIPLDANLCPYCAAEQGSATFLQHKSIQESLTSLYPPPYSAKKEPHKSETSMSEKKFQTASPIINTSIAQPTTEQNSSAAEEKSSFWPLLLLCVGANLLVIGLLQLFFSENNRLTLQWNSKYWFVYCLSALPLFYFGFKKVNES
jgi:hypothetical protein